MSSTRARTTEPFVTKEDVADFLCVCPRTVDRMLRRGLFPSYRPLGPHGPVRFRLSDIERAMRQTANVRRKTPATASRIDLPSSLTITTEPEPIETS